MEYHLDRTIEFIADIEPKTLYSWALREVMPDGQAAGSDLIPWDWTLCFCAESITFQHAIGVSHEAARHSSDEFIQVTLMPYEHGGRSGMRFSMFGTDRPIRSFSLDIYKATQREERSCRAWGLVSYTCEVDFRDETTDDVLWFNMVLLEEDYESCRYAALNNSTDYSLLFYVSGVSGFYSDWSPSVRTEHIKVLLNRDEHKVSLPENVKEIPCLGAIRGAKISIARQSVPAPREADAVSDGDEKPTRAISEMKSDELSEEQQRNIEEKHRIIWNLVGLPKVSQDNYLIAQRTTMEDIGKSSNELLELPDYQIDHATVNRLIVHARQDGAHALL